MINSSQRLKANGRKLKPQNNPTYFIYFKMKGISLFPFLVCFLVSCHSNHQKASADFFVSEEPNNPITDAQKKISDAAKSIIDPSILYDPTYFQLDYPNGDVPIGKGVCTDVVIRTYRKLGVDLQKEVHEDMKTNFQVYPKIWGLSKPDTNIDHRRVPNLMVYFDRFGIEKAISNNPEDYDPGDIICWRLPNGMTHIGMMIDEKSRDNERFLIVHNIGQGQIAEDILFDFEIIGHYAFENFE
jgi:uncharacterized protein YijF (DUF1287 family)